MMQKQITTLLALSLLFCLAIAAQDKPAEKKIKSGLTEEDWKYTLPDGITTREVTFYSDGVACWAKLFFPKASLPPVKRPASC